jgi:hypothetical protein
MLTSVKVRFAMYLVDWWELPRRPESQGRANAIKEDLLPIDGGYAKEEIIYLG